MFSTYRTRVPSDLGLILARRRRPTHSIGAWGRSAPAELALQLALLRVPKRPHAQFRRGRRHVSGRSAVSAGPALRVVGIGAGSRGEVVAAAVAGRGGEAGRGAVTAGAAGGHAGAGGVVRLSAIAAHRAVVGAGVVGGDVVAVGDLHGTAALAGRLIVGLQRGGLVTAGKLAHAREASPIFST